MVAHKWTELGPRVWLQGPRVPELESDCWWVQLNSDTAGGGVWGVLRLVWPCWWQGLRLVSPQADVGPLVGEAGAEFRAGSLVGGARAQLV